MMKYPQKTYEETDFFGPDEDMQNHEQKIVKVRKEHICCNCQQKINIGEFALLEKCFLDGPQQAYTCIPCCNKWLDEMSEEAQGEVERLEKRVNDLLLDVARAAEAEYDARKKAGDLTISIVEQARRFDEWSQARKALDAALDRCREAGIKLEEGE